MRLARSTTAIIMGVDAHLVDVEAVIAEGLPATAITGLGDTAIKEARERMRAACASTGFAWPQARVTVGLSPAALPKHGSTLDLAMALAVLAATGTLDTGTLAGTVILGELGLDGRVRRARGVLPVVLAAAASGARRVIVPLANAGEAELVDGIELLPVASLGHCLRLLGVDCEAGVDTIEERPAAPPTERIPDLAEVRGQHAAKHALEVAAAGGHHLALVGPPGVGKTLLAERLPGILPPLAAEVALEVTAIRSIFADDVVGLQTVAPFAAPHHGATRAAIVGGGKGDAPSIGVISRAHRGVLFLDEAPEFPPSVLDALRQPLEAGVIEIARSSFRVRIPARFQLVVAANPCPCGHAFDRNGRCTCTPAERRKYLSRISGPLLDRIDVRVVVEMPSAVDAAVGSAAAGDTTAVVAQRVYAARERQQRRLHATPWHTNAEVPGHVLRTEWRLPPASAAVLNDSFQRGEVASMRGADRTLRLAWTCADLAGRDVPSADDLRLAMRLRDAGGRWAA